jgi:hypothetical protein
MRLGIIGKSAAGKTTLFSLLSGISYESSLQFQFERKFHFATIKVPDERLVKIWETQKPKNMVEATLDIIDTEPILDSNQRKSNNIVLATLRETDGIICIISSYQKRDDSEWIFKEIEIIETEIILSDLDIVEKRIDKIKHQKGRGNLSLDELQEEEKFLTIIKEHIESGKNLNDIHLTTQTEKFWKNYGLLSRKPLIIILNISELDLSSKDKYIEVKKKYPYSIFLPLKLEYEISLLAPDEQQNFLSDYGLKSLQIFEVIKICYDALELCTFFTIGKDEVRAWTIKKGDSALIAAGKIHTDMARGFIAADVVPFQDWIKSASFKITKEQGKLRSEGKDYIVKDGDIINLKFNI